MSYQYHIADVFTDKPFGGNQLAVLPDARGLSDEQMAIIAREFNFSETVFVFPPDDPSHTRKLRIFTPGKELPFAGHPTVGAAHVLALTGEFELTGDETQIVFGERVGPVRVLIRSKNGTPVFAQLTTARIPEKGGAELDPATIADVVSLDLADLDVDDRYAIQGVSVGLPFLIVPLRSVDALRRARIDMPKWEATLKESWAPEVFVFTEDDESKARGGALNGDGVIRARMFGPTIGIGEDPATGSACACLGGYLAWRSARRDGLLRYSVHQGVEMGRPSLVEVEADVTGGVVSAIRVGGATVLIASGELYCT
jgi:trans-2,3-dihydro-3-hydroxyanthranilate isomerase